MNIQRNQSLQILFEDDAIIVIKKPAGIATQSSNIRTPDIVSLLKRHLMLKTASKGKPPYLAVIHRLDQPVEGILVFAKTKNSAKNLSDQLKKSDFSKKYRALISFSQKPEKTNGLLVDYLKKEKAGNHSIVCQADDPDAKRCQLSYFVIDENEKNKRYYATPSDSQQIELDIILDTGRHHQIRVQLSNLGCPILGDQKYGDDFSKKYARQLKLCAYELSFVHPITKKKLTFSLL